jgi:hypothetical protein
MFINPMWDHESQRIGKKKCSQFAYHMHVTSDLIGFIALLALIYGLYSLVFHEWRNSLFLIGLSIMAAIFGNILHGYSWSLVEKKNFKYDYENAVSTWIESGKKVTYKYINNGKE